MKSLIYSELARMGMALGSPKRLELIDLLCQREYGVEDLAKTLGESVAATSHHLQVLKRARLAVSRKEGQRVIYRLTDKVPGLWVALCAAGEKNLAEIRTVMSDFLKDAASFTEMTAGELRRRQKAGEVLVIDVRPAKEYEAAHFPDAVSVPLDDLESRIRRLPKDREVIAYCRGPYCLLSHDAVTQLRNHGYRARRWTQGVPDWLTQGVRLAQGPQSRRAVTPRIAASAKKPRSR